MKHINVMHNYDQLSSCSSLLKPDLGTAASNVKAKIFFFVICFISERFLHVLRRRCDSLYLKLGVEENDGQPN
jgi:hypothetical protein